MIKDTDTIQAVRSNDKAELKKLSADIRVTDMMMKLEFHGIPGVAVTEDEDGRIQLYMSHQFDIQDGFENLMANNLLKLTEKLLGDEIGTQILAYTIERADLWFEARSINPEELDIDSIEVTKPELTPEQRDNYAKDFTNLFGEMEKEGFQSFVTFGTDKVMQTICNMLPEEVFNCYVTVFDGILSEEETLDPRNLAIYVSCMIDAWNDHMANLREEAEASQVAGKA